MPALPAAQAQQRQPQPDGLRLESEAEPQAAQRPAPDGHHAEVAALPPLRRYRSPHVFAPPCTLGSSGIGMQGTLLSQRVPPKHALTPKPQLGPSGPSHKRAQATVQSRSVAEELVAWFRAAALARNPFLVEGMQIVAHGSHR